MFNNNENNQRWQDIKYNFFKKHFDPAEVLTLYIDEIYYDDILSLFLIHRSLNVSNTFIMKISGSSNEKSMFMYKELIEESLLNNLVLGEEHFIFILFFEDKEHFVKITKEYILTNIFVFDDIYEFMNYLLK